MVDDVSVGVQERDNVVDVAFLETNGLLAPFIWDLNFDFSPEYICKSHCHF